MTNIIESRMREHLKELRDIAVAVEVDLLRGRDHLIQPKIIQMRVILNTLDNLHFENRTDKYGELPPDPITIVRGEN